MSRREVRYASRSHSCTHPEGWRDWPYETPPTCSRSHAGMQGGNSIRLQTKQPGRCGWGLPGALPNLRRNTPGGGRRPMPADALKCKECQTTYPLEARFVCERCFGPLEVSYTLPEGDPAALKRRIQAGPHNIWRYADFLPLQGAPRSALPTGWTPLVRADRLAAAARARRALHQERDRESDPFVQGPRGLDRLGSCCRARVRHARVCVDRQPGERRRGARRGRRSARLRPDPARPRGAEDPRRRAPTARRSSPSRATTTTSTGSAPRSAASGRGGRS